MVTKEQGEQLRHALQLLNQKQFVQAEQIARQILKELPRNGDAYYLLGLIALNHGIFSLARSLFAAATRCRGVPVPDVYTRLGLERSRANQYELACDTLQLSKARQPRSEAFDKALIEAQIGGEYYAQGKYEQALAYFEKAQSFCPNWLELPLLLARALHSLRRMDQAQPYFEKALEIAQEMAQKDPNSHYAQRNLLSTKWEFAMQLLLNGEFTPGWEYYDTRIELQGKMALHICPFPLPLWQGEDLKGKTILIHGEQGLGDEIMFASMFDDLIARAGHVIIASANTLAELTRRSFPKAQVIAHDRSNPQKWQTQFPTWFKDVGVVHYQAPFGNLPRWLRPDLKSFDHSKPYLKADSALSKHFKAELDAKIKQSATQSKVNRKVQKNNPMLVGLVWSGNLTTGLMGSRKSIDLHRFKAFDEMDNVQLVSLHNSEHGWQLSLAPEMDVWDFSGQLVSMDHTAALMSQMDLVISVDTSTAHLAGALGLPTWVPLWYAADWRWMWKKPTSIWYPKVRLFHQKVSGDWQPVIDELLLELKNESKRFNALKIKKNL